MRATMLLSATSNGVGVNFEADLGMDGQAL